ncbi:hypothetical protein [Mycobacterium sp.]|uniref:hypothetical protein n=1 Tax=Mycobacterium sp. TaxID=1785 RepID=UPI002D30BF73|nr:hypothetical protein [Mycobacterium sp.]HZA10457.1 hypothetical protein [Mycobacterium sp.]
MHAANSIVDEPHSWAGEPPGDMPHYLGSEPVVAEEDIADAGYQNSGRDGPPFSYMRRIFM